MTMDGINGSVPASPNGEAPAQNTAFSLPSGEPAGAPEVAPGVAVEISEAAKARLDSMMAPSELSSDTFNASAENGGVEFGVEMGGFDWPLNAGADSTVSTQSESGDDGWLQSSESDSLTGIAESSESAYLALGKSTVNAAE